MHVIVHGGAGSAPDAPEERMTAVSDALARGREAASPLDAVERAVGHMESAPQFNAGTGGARQSDGVVRTDAGLMTGAGEAGAACSMPGVEHAASVARLVLEETPHVLLAGDGAVRFAEAFGIETDVDLLTARTRDRWGEEEPRSNTREQLAAVRDRFGSGDGRLAMDTVGAVAVAGDEIAVATSTGGRWFALAGRVGDVPQIGAGFYAAEAGAASATGEGEAIARFGLARTVVEHIGDGVDPAVATDRAIAAFEEATGGAAGVIAMDAAGNSGSAFNTESMQTARAQ